MLEILQTRAGKESQKANKKPILKAKNFFIYGVFLRMLERA